MSGCAIWKKNALFKDTISDKLHSQGKQQIYACHTHDNWHWLSVEIAL